jgi:hypothetical protein
VNNAYALGSGVGGAVELEVPACATLSEPAPESESTSYEAARPRHGDTARGVMEAEAVNSRWWPRHAGGCLGRWGGGGPQGTTLEAAQSCFLTPIYFIWRISIRGQRVAVQHGSAALV